MSRCPLPILKSSLFIFDAQNGHLRHSHVCSRRRKAYNHSYLTKRAQLKPTPYEMSGRSNILFTDKFQVKVSYKAARVPLLSLPSESQTKHTAYCRPGPLCVGDRQGWQKIRPSLSYDVKSVATRPLPYARLCQRVHPIQATRIFHHDAGYFVA